MDDRDSKASALSLIRVLDDVATDAREEAGHHHEGCSAKEMCNSIADICEGASSKIRAATGGPAQVATPMYRKNYDAIFGKQPVGQG
jgi:hypothetical protein